MVKGGGDGNPLQYSCLEKRSLAGSKGLKEPDMTEVT